MGLNKDVSISIDNTRFNFRVAGYVEHNGKVLLHRPYSVDFWNMVGGRAQAGEDSASAIKREFGEELGCEIKDLKLIEVCENFYVFREVFTQEQLFIYKITLHDDDPILTKQDFKQLDEDKAVFHWFDKSEIANIKCLPELIYDIVQRKDDTFVHGLLKSGVYTKI